MARKKKTLTPVEVFEGVQFAESFKPEMTELMKRLHIKRDMSLTSIIRTTREYLENQTNPVRACNAILFKLGVHQQFKSEPRKARVYAFTAIEQSLLAGEDFDPTSVADIANKRLDKISLLLGPDVEVVMDNPTTSAPKPKSKKDMVVDIFVKNKDKPTAELVKIIVDKLKVEKQSAYSLLYAARKSMIV